MHAHRGLILTALALTLGTAPAAFADHLNGDIRKDRAAVERDRAELRQLERKLSTEQRELNAARAHERREFETGHLYRAWRDARQVRREQGEVNAVKGRIADERAELARRRADLDRDLARNRR